MFPWTRYERRWDKAVKPFQKVIFVLSTLAEGDLWLKLKVIHVYSRIRLIPHSKVKPQQTIPSLIGLNNIRKKNKKSRRSLGGAQTSAT